MELQDKYIRFDWAVKRLLRHKANFGVLEGFLTVLIGDEIHIVEILESEGNQQTENDKFNRVDIKALNSKNEIVIIEIQNTRELYYLERILYGVAKAITEHISLGETYYKVKKIYSISILYFDIGHGTDYLYHGQNIFKGVHTGDFLQVSTREKDAIVPRMPSEIYPEYFLIRVNEFNKVAVTPLEEWIEYLKTGIIRPDTTAPGLGEAREKLKYYSMTPQERHAYDEHLSALMIQNDVLDSAKLEGKIEGRLEGRAEGREEGREEGIKEGVLRNARRMKEKGFSTEDIMEICRLAVETCYWPMFEVDHGKWNLTYEPKKKLPIEDFLRAQGRFKHLFKPGNEHLIEEFQKEVDRRWENLLYKCDR